MVQPCSGSYSSVRAEAASSGSVKGPHMLELGCPGSGMLRQAVCLRAPVLQPSSLAVPLLVMVCWRHSSECCSKARKLEFGTMDEGTQAVKPAGEWSSQLQCLVPTQRAPRVNRAVMMDDP